MDRRVEYLQNHSAYQPSLATTIAYGIGLLYVIHQVLVYFDYPVLSPQELLWNALVYIVPKQLLLERARRQELEANDMLSQTHAAKSEALRRTLGLGGHTLLPKLPAEGIMRKANVFVRQPNSDAPPGLGNWDNSCYQNSVLQGLASLDSLKQYLRNSDSWQGRQNNSTTESLLETVTKLSGSANNGQQLWTPAKLKSMSSWQQQDAQEYYSKIMDELDKEAAKERAAAEPRAGLESITEDRTTEPEQQNILKDLDNNVLAKDIVKADQRNPLDGLLAQRVACTRCGHSDGLSMIPFNCLTVPLGSGQIVYNIEDCLDEYTKLEEITDVECTKCTLLRAEQQLAQMLPSPPCYKSTDAESAVDSKVLKLPPELRAQAFKRLRAIQQALEEDDFTDKTLNETCHIPKKARVSSIKTRQAVIGRAPQSLVVHVNRSVFDEMTGVQRKNYASVRYPSELDLSTWMLDDRLIGSDQSSKASGSILASLVSDGSDTESTTAREDMRYRIKAVVTHYGRHENGHYICYRENQIPQEPVAETVDLQKEELNENATEARAEGFGKKWWRLSDEDVSPVSEADVLAQGGVFMLFYERQAAAETPARSDVSSMHVTEAVQASMVQRATAQNMDVEEAAAIPLPGSSDDELDVQPDESLATSSSIDNSDATKSTSPFDQPSTAPSTEATTEDEFEPETENKVPPCFAQTVKQPTATPVMRTARSRPVSRSQNGFAGNHFRAVAAS